MGTPDRDEPKVARVGLVARDASWCDGGVLTTTTTGGGVVCLESTESAGGGVAGGGFGLGTGETVGITVD